MANELFELSLDKTGNGNFEISEVRIVGKSQAKGFTYNLGRHSAASVTHVRDLKKTGVRLLGFQHGGCFVQGSGLNGCFSHEIAVIKLNVTAKTSTVLISTVRADTATLPFYTAGETLQTGSIPPALIGHQLTLLNPGSNGRCRALLR